MAEAHARGWPLVRHPVLHFPHDPVLRADAEARDGGAGRIREFMLGSEWLIVPVVEPGAVSVRGYVPGGAWVPLWCPDEGDAPAAAASSSGGVVRGPGWQQLPAPIGRPAIYHRQGAPSAVEVRTALGASGVHLGTC